MSGKSTSTSSASSASAAEGRQTASTSRRVRSAVLFAVGVALVVAAVWGVSGQTDELRRAWAAVRHAPAWMIAAVVVLPLGNWAATSVMFRELMNRYGRVGCVEMGALIGSAWLLNYLPFRPGSVGRVAYHRAVNGIRVRDSVLVMGLAVLCSVAALGVLIGVTIAAWWMRTGATALMLAVPLVLLPGVAMVVGRRSISAAPGTRAAAFWTDAEGRRRLAVSLAVRYADMLMWMVRYALVFRLIGQPITPIGAATVCAASQLAMFIPIQVGVREWVVGLTFALLQRAGGDSATDTAAAVGQAAPGLIVDLINRGAELLVSIPIGLASLVWLARRRAAAGRESGASGAV